ncbi:MAG: histidine kinase [Rhodobacteraceae bacterium PARR1]|nr:MAG: histidine kinase [Rhodobacteraceae bacterium PARR1]
MDSTDPTILAFLETVHPYDNLPPDELARVAGFFGHRAYAAGQSIFAAGEVLDGLYLVRTGEVEITDRYGAPVSILGPRNSFGERGLMREGLAVTTARAARDTVTLVLPPDAFRTLFEANAAFRRFFQRGRRAEVRPPELATQKVSDLMTCDPLTVSHDTAVREAARIMRDRHVSSLGVTEGGRFVGLVTTRDLANRVLAEGLPANLPIAQIMTPDPITLPPSALGSDVLHLMLERRIGHLPVTDGGKLVGIITQTDLTRFQAESSAQFVRDAAMAESIAQLGETTARIPRLLAQLVAAHNAHEVVTRLITDIADTVTRRLLILAERELGLPPVPYLWLACGSQGRQEQTGVSDQDNCLILDDAVTQDDLPYFAALAKWVSDGLDVCGYAYCPGDMMATNPRWCQSLSVWRSYFQSWVNRPDPKAQMLASVMFDLRPIAGDLRLFESLQAETLEYASRNTIFVAHMVANSLKHTPPLGLLRGFATIRSGEHKHHIDLKHNGVVPVTDLGRVYALLGQLAPANTRARLEAAEGAGLISPSGARDLVDAYDLIARTRIEHQARQVRQGQRPDNYLSLADLSDFERSHLRDAFVVVRTMQSSVGQSRGANI